MNQYWGMKNRTRLTTCWTTRWTSAAGGGWKLSLSPLSSDSSPTESFCSIYLCDAISIRGSPSCMSPFTIENQLWHRRPMKTMGSDGLGWLVRLPPLYFCPLLSLLSFHMFNQRRLMASKFMVAYYFCLSFSSSPAVPNKEMLLLCQKIISKNEDFAKMG